MLKLHRLEISGFKSFLDPVTTEFAEGITAIVGPNGCGKSNLSEAVTWALGEQSAKFLRSGKMEDVIFNGSQKRRPLGMAEVSLTLLCDPSFEAAIDGSLTIGRRVFRSGESQYRLNGKVVPLKQIRDLLMDTGLGIRSYSVVSQGQVESLLSGKPQERRKLIEEAAGVTRYKDRKRLAELKLEDALGNLQRLDDVVGELERSLRSLKRQANAARRFQEQEATERRLQRAVMIRQRAHLEARLRELRGLLETATTVDAELTAALHRDQARLTAGREEVDATAEKVSERHARLTSLAATIEGRQEFLKGGRQSRKDIEERLDRGRRVAVKLGEEFALQRQALESLVSKHSALSSEHDEAQTAVRSDQQEIERARQHLMASQASLDTLRAELLGSTAQITSVQTRLHQEQIESEKGNYRREHTDSELAKLAESQSKAATASSEAATAVTTIEERLGAKTDESEAMTGSLKQTLELEAEVNETRLAAKQEQAARTQRQEILEQSEAADAERRAGIEEAWSSLDLGTPRFLADELTVPAGWEESFDLYLENLRDAVLVAAAADIDHLTRTLSSAGCAAVLVQAGGRDRDEERAPKATEIVGIVGSALGLESELCASLPKAYMVTSGSAAADLARLYPQASFLSQDGIWSSDRIVRVQGGKLNPGALARRRDLEENRRRLPDLATELEELSERLDSLVGKRTREAETSHRLEAELGDIRQELAVAQVRQQETRERAAELEKAKQNLEEEQKSVVDELASIREQSETLRSQLEEAQKAHGELEERFDAAQAALEEARERRELLSTAGAGRQGRLDLLGERLEVHLQEKERLEGRCQGIERQTAEWQADEKALEKRSHDLEGSMEEAAEQLQSALEEQDIVERASHGEQAELNEKRGELKILAAEVDAVRERQEAGREKIQELRVAEASLQQDIAHLQESFADEFDREAQDNGDDSTDDNEGVSTAELEERLAQFRAKLERLGPVNHLAAQEYDEQHERHGFIVEQRADIQRSVSSLRGTIREINQTSGERFKATFDEVNRHFAEVYSQLFSGGEAEMRLLDEEDLLDSGIEIVARPPGKRMQNIMLLSGGEKALTAIALLFALFRTKASPFCILDEVDAALDDSNILRFVELLRSSAAATQFLVISHNKLTMEAASTLYGVTMEEQGVSKIVGVKLDEMHPAQEMAAAG